MAVFVADAARSVGPYYARNMQWEADQVDPHITTLHREPPQIIGTVPTDDDTGHVIPEPSEIPNLAPATVDAWGGPENGASRVLVGTTELEDEIVDVYRCSSDPDAFWAAPMSNQGLQVKPGQRYIVRIYGRDVEGASVMTYLRGSKRNDALMPRDFGWREFVVTCGNSDNVTEIRTANGAVDIAAVRIHPY